MDDVTYIKSTEAKQAFGALIDNVQHGPVIIKRQKRDIAVMVSMADYERFTRLNLEEFQNFRAYIAQKAKENGLTQDRLDALLSEDDD